VPQPRQMTFPEAVSSSILVGWGHIGQAYTMMDCGAEQWSLSRTNCPGIRTGTNGAICAGAAADGGVYFVVQIPGARTKTSPGPHALAVSSPKLRMALGVREGLIVETEKMRISVILEINNHLLKICAAIQPTLTKETAGADATCSGYEILSKGGLM
jgi:hypothetical protein